MPAPPRDPAPAGLSAPRARGAARVALLAGCVKPVLAPAINEAAIRLLNRARRRGGGRARARAAAARSSITWAARSRRWRSARNNIDAWTREIEGEGLDAILITVSGCGTTVKDYGFMLRNDPAYADEGRARVGARAGRQRVSRRRSTLPAGDAAAADRRLSLGLFAAARPEGAARAEGVACRKAGFVVKDVPEGHLCCGSAGTYNILQPELADGLRDRKVANIETLAPDVIAAGNIGCITQIAAGTGIPVVHTVELHRLGDRRSGAGGAGRTIWRGCDLIAATFD